MKSFTLIATLPIMCAFFIIGVIWGAVLLGIKAGAEYHEGLARKGGTQ